MNVAEIIAEPLAYDFMRRGLACAVLLSISGGLLGNVLMLRRLSLMGDALAHSLLPGIGIAFLLFGTSPVALFMGALLAGLFTALGSALLSRSTRLKEDAAFGSLFIVFFGVGVALVSVVGPRVNLMHFLFGNVLGVSSADLGLTLGTSLVTLAVFLLCYRPIVLETFDPTFYRATGGRGGWVHGGLLTLTVLNLVAALQTMGIVLALGLFLLPAVTASFWCQRLKPQLMLSVSLALVGSSGGILLSYHLGLPSGASIVLVLGLFFLVSATVAAWRSRR